MGSIPLLPRVLSRVHAKAIGRQSNRSHFPDLGQICAGNRGMHAIRLVNPHARVRTWDDQPCSFALSAASPPLRCSSYRRPVGALWYPVVIRSIRPALSSSLSSSSGCSLQSGDFGSRGSDAECRCFGLQRPALPEVTFLDLDADLSSCDSELLSASLVVSPSSQPPS